MENTIGMLNLDMVGRANGGVDISGLELSPSMEVDFQAAAAASGELRIRREGPGSGRSDDSSFIAKRVPAINFLPASTPTTTGRATTGKRSTPAASAGWRALPSNLPRGSPGGTIAPSSSHRRGEPFGSFESCDAFESFAVARKRTCRTTRTISTLTSRFSRLNLPAGSPRGTAALSSSHRNLVSGFPGGVRLPWPAEAAKQRRRQPDFVFTTVVFSARPPLVPERVRTDAA